MLPEVKKVKMPSLTLPTRWQTVIFRNFGYVKTERIALVLGCDSATVSLEAKRLGLAEFDYSADFESRGYITVIRSNWFLLSYGQLMTLLGIDEKRLDFILEKDDFLSVKLGGFKPFCEEISYAPLTEEQKKETERVARELLPQMAETGKRPFEFFEKGGEKSIFSIKKSKKRGKRIVHGYLSPCGDAFSSDRLDTLPDGLLERYRDAGINGIWLHGVLSSLSYYPFLPELSEGYKDRRKNLNKIIDHCKKYGISVYLYMNEPRALPVGVSSENERLIGWQEKRTLCLSRKEVKDYLYSAVRDLCESAPELGGIFTITMSENPTHCNFLPHTECPICKNIPSEESAAEVNNIFARAMKDSGCNGELIANLWGWSPYMGWSEEQIWRGIELLDKDIAVMCVSEYDLEIEKGGVESRVIDYSISNPGPSEITKRIAEVARRHGHKVYGKIQASNSWECAAVPYIPVFDLVAEHLENLLGIGVNDFFLTWTMGGYPSPSVSLACEYHKGFDLEKWYGDNFGNATVRLAVDRLCRAFREYPFSVRALYLSPHTLGAANLWDIEPEEKSSAMVSFAYDDFESWVYPYGIDVYLSQLEKMLSLWQEGIECLSGAEKSPKTEELLRYARVAYCHFKSDMLQTRFSLCKRSCDKGGMVLCLREEKENAKMLLSLMRIDPKIGYEASNHYFYTERNLLEKIVRMEKLETLLNEV